MAGTREIYRRLPGRRRGVVLSASMWMGSDHLLLVKSAWFREEYKRFYLRDIQAIVVAPCARFHVSRPLLICALLWMLPLVSVAFWPPGLGVVWVVATLAMVATWIAISAASSCRCRLYTAVSRDDLPSLYRTWTARKFLNQVKPSIDRVQGVVDAGWAEAERSHAGPAAPPAAGDSAARTARSGVPSHTLASDLFLLSLFVCAIVDLSVAHLHAAIWPKVTTGLSVAQLVGAVAVMVQRYRGLLGSAMHKLAIAALVLMGVMLYLQSFATSFTTFAIGAGVNPATAPVPLSPAFMATVHRVADGLDLLFGFIGAAIVLRSGEPASQ
jgi:hypothetical protein